MIHILIVEDEELISSNIAKYLKKNGFETFQAFTLDDAKHILASQTVHIMLLDINLPDGNGLTFAKSLRQTSPQQNTKIIFISAIDTDQAIIDGFALGGDDYITKPFRLPVLLARVQAVTTRYQLNQSDIRQLHDLTINLTTQQVFKQTSDISFSANEKRLFFYLYENIGVTLSREQILAYMWDNQGEYVNDNTLTVTLKRLREKIESNTPIIETKRGVGYRMIPDRK